MFYNYKILTVNNEEILYLYVNSIYEFSSELDYKNKEQSIFNKIKDYINVMDIKFNGKKLKEIKWYIHLSMIVNL